MAKQQPKITQTLKSEFFTLAELINSSTANKHHIDNTPPAKVIKMKDEKTISKTEILDALRGK